MGKLSKDRRDIYYRRAKEEGYRARSAYKLLQLDDELHFLSPPSLSRRSRQARRAREEAQDAELDAQAEAADVEDDGEAAEDSDGEQDSCQGEDAYPVRAVDLCAAPGSWSQVLRRRLWENYRRKLARFEARKARETQASSSSSPPSSPSSPSSSSLLDSSFSALSSPPAPPLIVAVDLQEMAPIPGVFALQADITHESTIRSILDFFSQQPADLVVCDGAPDVTGMHDIDEFIQAQLLFAALKCVGGVLKSGGAFVCKTFRGEQIPLVYLQLKTLFAEVRCCKPAASRNSSIEAFLVCKGFQPLPRHWLNAPSAATAPTEEGVEGKAEAEGDARDGAVQGCLVPFLACGDLAGYDADRNYPLDAKQHVFLPPTQPPVRPPYHEALQRKRGAGAAA
ncbi:putative ribosomal RNA large subunit methyltransferase FTSJ1 [Besnoitia besnoiti]|uniref:Putative tRNA (cytidine(32)/guanosine(34)-2'-O)-methyltransferase n=1 Tax=Besnoitia besnoiti TaxID=94643 RepID=A0A2A9MKG6_BESBE|nr:putative ribosomal RNA large subunit methyltransferase FTSJ1 [Besnoitia besnoiti]PFH37704.1 putative ribosomal RNA large subunit methyltransferase FTSJ1 [Besnoitia besnoiti]